LDREKTPADYSECSKNPSLFNVAPQEIGRDLQISPNLSLVVSGDSKGLAEKKFGGRIIPFHRAGRDDRRARKENHRESVPRQHFVRTEVPLWEANA